MKKLAPVLFCISVCFSVSTLSYAEKMEWTGDDFTAMQVTFDTALPKKMAKSKVYVSKTGIRIEGISDPNSPMPNITSLFRFKDDKSLIIDPKQKAYAVIEENGKVDVEDDLGTVLSIKPCEGFKKAKNTGEVKFQKRQVQKWACLHPSDGSVAFQFFDPKLKMVVKEDINGHISELREIKPGKIKSSLFDAPKDYRKMTMAEMMTGYVKLERYKDNK